MFVACYLLVLLLELPLVTVYCEYNSDNCVLLAINLLFLVTSCMIYVSGENCISIQYSNNL